MTQVKEGGISMADFVTDVSTIYIIIIVILKREYETSIFENPASYLNISPIPLKTCCKFYA